MEALAGGGPGGLILREVSCGETGYDTAGRLLKRSYLGSFFEYTFDTALGSIFVTSTDLDDILPIGTEVGLSLAGHGVSVVPADR